MGPASEATRSSGLTDPPMYDPTADFQEWRRNVARWVDTIQSASKRGKDKHYKTLYATLGQQLYDRGLPSAQKSLVDEHQKAKLINYKQDNQLEAVRQIVELVAVDPPIVIVSRLISSFNTVIACHRKPDEDLNGFLSRFRGLAPYHLMHCGLSASSQVGEVLAITLLNNARLSDETLTNAKLQLITLAQARDAEENNHSFHLDKTLMDDLFRRARQLTDLESHLESFITSGEKDSEELLREKLHAAIKKIRRIRRKLGAALLQVEDPENHDELSTVEKLLRPPKRCKLHLEDAVTVLRNLCFAPSNQQKPISKAQIENIVGQRLQKALYFLSKSQEHRTVLDRLGSKQSNPTSKRRSSRSKPSNASAASSTQQRFCFDCGSVEHVRGDPSCPTPCFLVRKRNLERANADYNGQPSKRRKVPVNQKDNDTNPSNDAKNKSFPTGSNAAPSMRNHA